MKSSQSLILKISFFKLKLLFKKKNTQYPEVFFKVCNHNATRQNLFSSLLNIESSSFEKYKPTPNQIT